MLEGIGPTFLLGLGPPHAGTVHVMWRAILVKAMTVQIGIES